MKAKYLFPLILFNTFCFARTAHRPIPRPPSMPGFIHDFDSWEPDFNFESDHKLDKSFPVYLRFRGIEHEFQRNEWSIGTIFMKLAGENSYLDCLRDHEREYKRNVESLEALFQKVHKNEE